MRRLGTFAAGLLVAGLAALTWAAVPAEAGDVTTASWTQLRTTSPLGDSPDLQSTDGHALPVSNTALGPVAVAALRFPGGSATLELTRVDPASALPTSALPSLPVPAAVVWACPATTPWQAGDRQPWGSRPDYDCGRHAIGNVTAGGMFWDLTGLADTGVDLVLVPPPGDVTPYSLTFAAPTAASFQSLAAADPPPAAAPEEPVDEPVTGQPRAGSGSAQEPALPVVPVSSPAAAPPVVASSPQALVPRQVQVSAVAADAAPRWVGPALLAFFAFLLMAKAALPAAAGGPPRSLVVTRHGRETS